MIELDCHPKILAVGKTLEFSVVLPEAVTFTGKLRVFLHPFEQAGTVAERELSADSIRHEHGRLRIDLCLPAEQEYLIRIFGGARMEGWPLAECRVYGVRDDLVPLRPLKGDFHMHSIRSDGTDQPEQVAIACRRIGLDFMALTDHRQYEPSLEAARPFAGLPLEFGIFPGEEVHPPGNPVHMINFGGRASVNALFSDSSYKAEVAALAAGVEGFENPSKRDQYASCVWCYDKIRELGGLGIFCHPYWIEGTRFNVSEPVIARHFRERPFGAYEVFGGFAMHEYEANTLQAARYHEERIHDSDLPIVGASDSHGCDVNNLFGWYYTIVFAASSRLPDIIDAVRQFRAVAVAALPGRPPEVIGPFRLVKLALFLMREYMPGHDVLCRQQAGIMQRCLTDPEGQTEAASASQKRLTDYHRRLWKK